MSQVTNLLAFGIGGAVVGIQYLQYKGYIHIDYKKLYLESSTYLDINQDGIIDKQDIYVVYRKLNNILGKFLRL